MKKVFTILSLLVLLGMTSCSTSDSLQPISPTNSDIMLELAGTKWALTEGCPAHTFLTINGFDECDYLNELDFEAQMVYIKHESTSYMVPHHICYVYGNKLIVSIQECSNTTWKSMFEWDVVNMTGNALRMRMSAPNIAPGYNFEFNYEKIG